MSLLLLELAEGPIHGLIATNLGQKWPDVVAGFTMIKANLPDNNRPISVWWYPDPKIISLSTYIYSTITGTSAVFVNAGDNMQESNGGQPAPPVIRIDNGTQWNDILINLVNHTN